MGSFEVKWDINPFNNISKPNTEETEFVKNIRKSHCKGCRDEEALCTACAVLDCWLRKTYLPEGEWQKAVEYDFHTTHMQNIIDDIDKRIIEELNHKYNNYGE